MSRRGVRRALTPADRRAAEAARLEAVVFERLSRCGACLDAARAAVVNGEATARACVTCGGGLLDPAMLVLLGQALVQRSAGRAAGRLPGF
jgi:hypothetical protein